LLGLAKLPFFDTMNKNILLALSILNISLPMAIVAPARAQTDPDDFTTEPDKTMAASHQSFVKGDTNKAAAQIHKAATYVRDESDQVAASAKADLQKAGDALDKVGQGIKDGTVKSADELKKTFATVDHVIADSWHETAQQAKASGKDAEEALRKAGAALDGAARWSGTKLKEGAQASVDALKKAGRKTGEGVKAGAKQVEGWLKDIGNGIKEVGRKL
jgi:hypothetical protein